MAPSPSHASAGPRRPVVERADDHFVGRFHALGGPCSVLVDGDDAGRAAELTGIAAEEAWRIERKFSRYRTDSVVGAINGSGGRPVTVDEETAHLLDYATTCWELSEGLFDITSGVLRKVWTFDGGRNVPKRRAIASCLEHVGWSRVTWWERTIVLPAGMEIDLGGIGKEYAVDRAAALVEARTSDAFVVNFGGDLFASGLRRGGRTWGVGIDDPRRTGGAAVYRLDVARAGLATSGDARRFVTWRGRRLGHILDPRTGWPVEDAPGSVTVVAPTCLEAGTLSTLAYLRGPGARDFLETQGVSFWIL